MTKFYDLHALTENERIAQIHQAIAAGHTVAFIVETPSKADWYLRKLRRKCRFTVIGRFTDPGQSLVTVKVGPEVV